MEIIKHQLLNVIYTELNQNYRRIFEIFHANFELHFVV
jgi:hypothetical protein